MKTYLFGVKYVLSYPLKKEKTPLICGLVMHNTCNLKCRHCTIYERSEARLSFEQAVEAIDLFYDKGGRTLYYEGGEPMLWKDRNYTLDDLITYAKGKGYLANIIYTNGTLPLESKADTIFISVDGLERTNDYLRGKAFNRIMDNIQRSSHPALYINYTINAYNKDEILDFCKFINPLKKIRAIFFYFHTPYYGYDELYIDEKGKQEIISMLIKNKKYYRILNSYAGLRSSLRNDWKRPLDICQIYENGHTYKCCRFNDNENLCRECGYLSYAEINQVLKWRPSAIRNAIRYF